MENFEVCDIFKFDIMYLKCKYVLSVICFYDVFINYIMSNNICKMKIIIYV